MSAATFEIPTTLIIPASGRSMRFGAADKLLADLAGKPVLDHVIGITTSLPFDRRLAVVPSIDTQRRALFEQAGFDIIDNEQPELGMGRSLSLATHECMTPQAIIMLADMPLMPAAHIRALASGRGEADAIFTQSAAITQPPVCLSQSAIETLRHVSGDAGLRALRQGAKTLALPEALARDIDTHDELNALRANWLALSHARDNYEP